MLDGLPSSCLHPLRNEEEPEAGKYIESVNHTPFVGQLIRTLTFYIFMSTLGHNVARPCAARSPEYVHKMRLDTNKYTQFGVRGVDEGCL